MNAEVFCIASSKGGSGKTILTASIASFLSGLGKKCLIIDCDAATHGLTLLYLVEASGNPNESKKGLFEIPRSSELQKCLKASVITVENSIDLLPATYNFTPDFDPEEVFEENSLSDVINVMKPEYDFIFLDAQAGSDKYSRLAMKKSISDEVIIVSEYDPVSAAGIERLKQVVGDDLNYTRTWVLLNKMLPEFVDKFSEFLSITKYLSPIPWNADVVRSYAKRKLALDLESGNAFTLSIMRTVSALLGERIQNDIAAWAEKRTYALKEPLEVQYADAEKELKYFLKSQDELELKEKRRRILGMYGILVPILLMPIVVIELTDIRIFEAFTKIFGRLDKFAAVLLVLGLALPILYSFTMRLFKSEKTAESARYKRKILVLEEKLRQLEALRSADFETMVKNKDVV